MSVQAIQSRVPTFIPPDLADKLPNRQTPWEPDQALSQQLVPIPKNDPKKYREYVLTSGPLVDFVMRYCNVNPARREVVSCITYIDNPTLRTSFETGLILMEGEANNPKFAPTWKQNTKDRQEREKVLAEWEALVEPFSPLTVNGETITNAKVFPGFHGCSDTAADSIAKTGSAYFGKCQDLDSSQSGSALSTDDGYFGRGIYGTDSFAYARKYGKKIFISWFAMREPRPVIGDVKHPKMATDMKQLKGHGKVAAHNAHFISVASIRPEDPNCMLYYPCHTAAGQEADCHEIVVFDSRQVLPWIVISVAPIPNWKKSMSLTYTVDDCYEACKSGRQNQVMEWINQDKTRLEHKMVNRETVHFAAVLGDQISILEWLYKQNLSLIGTCREDGCNILHLAAAFGRLEIARWIKRYCPQLLNQNNDQDDSPLYMAAFFGQKEILLEFIDEVKKDPKIILKLVQTSNTEMVDFLIQNGVSLNVVNDRNQTLLHLAAESGQKQNVVYLQSKGLDINALDKDKKTPLFLAVTNGHDAIVDHLLQDSAKTDTITTSGDTLFHTAASYGRITLLDKLHPVCPNLVDIPDDDGKTPLHRSVWEDPKPQVVAWFSDHGVNVNAKTYNRVQQMAFNYTPLHWAAKHGHLESAKLLILNGASQIETNINGETPLDLAIRFGQDHVARYLIDPQFDGSQEALFTSPPTQEQCIARFAQAYQNQEHVNQVLCLEKLGDLFLQKKNYLDAAHALNGVFVLAKNYGLPQQYQRLIFKKLERIEGEFILEKFKLKTSPDFKDYLQKFREELATIRTTAEQALTIQTAAEVQIKMNQELQQLFSQLVQHCSKMIDKKPPSPFAVVSFGSLARGEMLPNEKIAFGIFVENSTPEITSFFKSLYEFLKLRMVNIGETEHALLPSSATAPSRFTKAGFQFDTAFESFEMVVTPESASSIQTKADFERNPSRMGREALLVSSLVSGESSVYEKYQKATQLSLDEKKFFGKKWREDRALKTLQEHVQKFQALIHIKKIKLSQYSLNKGLYQPLLNVIHTLGVYYGVNGKNAFEIIKALETQQVLNRDASQNLQTLQGILTRASMLTHNLLKEEQADISLTELMEKNLVRREDLLEVYRVFIPLQKACEDFVVNPTKVFANKAIYDATISIE